MTARWLTEEAVRAFHLRSLDEHGGIAGLRDQGGLQAALARPLHKAAYGEPSIFDLAAAYAFGIAKNHPFVDGNKRTAAIAMGVFLMKNGFQLTAPNGQLLVAIRDLAAGDMTEEQLALWLSESCVAR
ncbi:MAG: type II toxin-antitoxin system death-on-curing family toxin [Tistlia sp.]|uniref:type II toxin-antitoxin system death-on-curing family toxin n=1 Tax=Tistlia sp. TaxID=3057121 RepID=UPI0034A45B1D